MTSLLTATASEPSIRVFGTDGVRGRVGAFPVDEGGFFALGSAFGRYLCDRSSAPRIVVGRDTRASSELLQASLVEGMAGQGCDVTLVGVAPSSAVSYLTRLFGFSGGAMITASHNPAQDNGLKLFRADGSKLAEESERAVESLAFDQEGSANGRKLGALAFDSSLLDKYVEFLCRNSPASTRLDGFRLVVDCANGAASEVARRAFERLGDRLALMEDAPTGKNINEACGAVHPQAMAKAVRAAGASLGLALDGDADRSVFADGDGAIIPGDQVLYALALASRRSGLSGSNTVVGTVLTNRGLERALTADGIRLLRTPIGDRHISRELRATHATVGGEASGHYLFGDALPVSDGIYTCLRLLDELLRAPGGALPRFEPTHQVTLNLQLERPLSESQIEACDRIAATVAAELGNKGRLVVRPSGTEPLLRLMVDADEAAIAEAAAGRVRESLADVLKLG